MRHFINKFGYVVVGAVVILAVTFLWLGTRKKAAPAVITGNPDLAYFVDENTGAESVKSADEIPPLAGSDGKESLVIAMKFKADTEKDAKTYYLVKYPTQVRDKVQGMAKDDLQRMNMLESNRLVRAAATGSPWLAMSNPQAAAVVTVPEESPGHPRKAAFPVSQ